MRNDKVARIRTSPDSNLEFYVGCANSSELVGEVFEALGMCSSEFTLINEMPENTEASGTFEDVASRIDADYFTKKAQNLERIQTKFTEYLASQD